MLGGESHWMLRDLHDSQYSSVTRRFATMESDFRGLGFVEDEAVVVTGAASGIGRATALTMARSGVAVALWDMAESLLDELATEIEDLGGRAHKVLVDV